MQPTVEMIEDN